LQALPKEAAGGCIWASKARRFWPLTVTVIPYGFLAIVAEKKNQTELSDMVSPDTLHQSRSDDD